MSPPSTSGTIQFRIKLARDTASDSAGAATRESVFRSISTLLFAISDLLGEDANGNIPLGTSLSRADLQEIRNRYGGELWDGKHRTPQANVSLRSLHRECVWGENVDREDELDSGDAAILLLHALDFLIASIRPHEQLQIERVDSPSMPSASELASEVV